MADANRYSGVAKSQRISEAARSATSDKNKKYSRGDGENGMLKNRWSVLAASFLGMIVGPGPILVFSYAVLLRPRDDRSSR